MSLVRGHPISHFTCHLSVSRSLLHTCNDHSILTRRRPSRPYCGHSAYLVH